MTSTAPRLILAALAVYSLWAALLILQAPGLQYDEALLVLGSVHMRHSREEIKLPHDPDTWIAVGGRMLPLMTASYVGAAKEYICLPLFAVFGTRAEPLRILNALLGILGIWGLARLIAEQVSPGAGAAAAGVMAMHPAYVDLTVFDNGTVAIWMAAFGLLCLAAARYLRVRSFPAAFWLGAAAGFGVWARANFVWLLASVAAATLVVLRARIRAPWRHWVAALAGALTGGSFFLIYLSISHGGAWQAIDQLASHDPLTRRILGRFILFTESLISDAEHRAMWSGPRLPAWEHWFALSLILAACAICLFNRRTGIWARGATLAFLFLAAILFVSRLPVAEHHLIVLIPILAVVFVSAALALPRAAAASLAVLYFGCALYFQIAAVRGLWTTGGVGQWSDAVYDLEETLERNYADKRIQILDWGLQNNLYVLSDGRVQSTEIYADATIEHSRFQRPWADEIRQGGVFLMNGPDNRQFPAASLGFLDALRVAHPRMRRYTIWQRNDQPYAEIFDIAPSGS